MAVKRFKESSVLVDKKYTSLLAGNDYYVPPSFESIASITLGSSVINNDFTGIPSTYKHLQIRIMGRLDDAGSGAGALRIRVGNSTFDTGSNYARHNLEGDGASAGAQSAVSQTNIAITGTLPENSVTANVNGVAIIDIHDYASTTKNKTFRSFSGQDRNGGGNVLLISGLWMSTSAINQIRLYGDGSGLKAGTVISLYGIKG
jgi:hypothetical protein